MPDNKTVAYKSPGRSRSGARISEAAQPDRHFSEPALTSRPDNMRIHANTGAAAGCRTSQPAPPFPGPDVP